MKIGKKLPNEKGGIYGYSFTNGIRLSPYRYNFRGITTFPLGIRFS